MMLNDVILLRMWEQFSSWNWLLESRPYFEFVFDYLPKGVFWEKASFIASNSLWIVKCPEALVLKLLLGGTATRRQHFFMIYSGNSAEEKESEVVSREQHRNMYIL